MIVGLVGMSLVTVAGCAAALLIYWTVRRFGTRHLAVTAAVLVGLTVSAASLPPILFGLRELSTTTLIDMDPREGERRLSHYGLPANTTSDFCYRVSSVGVTLLADFQITEADFLRWMSGKKWNAIPFDHGPDESSIPIENANFPDGFSTDPLVYPVREYESRTSHQIKRGYCYFWSRPNNDDHTIKVIFDCDTNRAYFEHTTY